MIQDNDTLGGEDHEGLLFLGHWQEAQQRWLFHDPVLEPVDKVVWAVIRHHAEVGNATSD
jgi:hypothetical protein